ncbi:uncharacterized protein C8A04DRAFT_26904 [Dichotomopilus funicola]|uniref:Uncharacterized protein n=1 Tax=Dichotomopilus funicola TaxID=1934379 RepID=A0AAN6V7C8_9PEZI|nr:hypothetical protein C8A04DRAFT_26904 [Dichotomopilus funicola]
MSTPENNDNPSPHNTTQARGSVVSAEEGNSPSKSSNTSQRNTQFEPIRGGTTLTSKILRPNGGVHGDTATDPEESEVTMTRELIKFFREVSPPPGNPMSRPDNVTLDPKAPNSAPLPRKKGSFRSALIPLYHRFRSRRELKKAKPGHIVLPDSAVAGTSDGGHRHIAISIPVEHDHLDLVASNAAADPAARDQPEGGEGSGSPGRQSKGQPLRDPDPISTATSRRHSISTEAWTNAEMPPLTRSPGRHSISGPCHPVSPLLFHETVTATAGSTTPPSLRSSVVLPGSFHGAGSGYGGAGGGGGGQESDSDNDVFYTAHSSQVDPQGSDTGSQSLGGYRGDTDTDVAQVPVEEGEEEEPAYSAGASSSSQLASFHPPPSSGVNPRVSVRGTPNPPLARLYGGALYEPHALSDIVSASSPDPSPTSPTSPQSALASQEYSEGTSTNGGLSTPLRTAASAQSIRSRHPRRVSGLADLRGATQSQPSTSTPSPDTSSPQPPVRSPLRAQGRNGSGNGNGNGSETTNGGTSSTENGNSVLKENENENDNGNGHTEHPANTLPNRNNQGVIDDLETRLGRLERSHAEWLSRLIPIIEQMAQHSGLTGEQLWVGEEPGQAQQSTSQSSFDMSPAHEHPPQPQEEGEHQPHETHDSDSERPTSHQNGSVHGSVHGSIYGSTHGSTHGSSSGSGSSNGNSNRREKGKGRARPLIICPPRSSTYEPSTRATTSSGTDGLAGHDGTHQRENGNGSGGSARNTQMRDSGIAGNDDHITLTQWLEGHYTTHAESSRNAAAAAAGTSGTAQHILSGPDMSSSDPDLDLSMLPPLNMTLADFEVGGREWRRHRGPRGSQGLVGEEEDDVDGSGMGRVTTVMEDLLRNTRTVR